MPDLLDLPARAEERQRELAEKIKLFLGAECRARIDKAVVEGTSLTIEFSLLEKFGKVGNELAAALLEEPAEFFAAAAVATREYTDKMPLRIINLPDAQKVNVRDLRAKHLGTFISVEGTIRRASEVRPEVIEITWECPACNTLTVKERIGNFVGKPFQCSNPNCGSRFGFREREKRMIDVRMITIEEPFELTEGDRPSQVAIMLTEDLTIPDFRRMTDPGNRIKICGVLKEIPHASKDHNVKMDIIMHANSVQPTETGWERLEVTEDDEAAIIKLATDPGIYKKLVRSLAPSIYGMDEIKESIVFQLFGGVPTKMKDRTHIRGDIHILLIGDPSAGKSQLLKLAPKITPRGKYVSGKGVSSAGLCVAPDSMVMMNPGGLPAIQDVVETTLDGNMAQHQEGIWKANHITKEQRIYTLDDQLKIASSPVSQFWKLRAPKKMVALTTESGKSITVTLPTKLFTISGGIPCWKEAHELRAGDYLAAARSVASPESAAPSAITLLTHDPVVHGIKNDVREMVKKLQLQYGSIRVAAKELGLPENSLYHWWVNESARANIRLSNLKTILKAIGMDITSIQKDTLTLSLYNGKPITIPTTLTPDLLYFAGLIAGDGDLSVTATDTVSIRFSNSSPFLLETFAGLAHSLFSKNCGRAPRTETRPPALRFASRLVADILNGLGIPCSPKSHRIDMSPVLLHCGKAELAHFLRGMFDTDGSVVLRKTKGSSYVDLTTTSKAFASKLVLVLLRWGIHAHLRNRPPSPTPRIHSKHQKWIIEIRGKTNISLFNDHIGFCEPAKLTKLHTLLRSVGKEKTNVDVIPGSQPLIRALKHTTGCTSRQMVGYKTSSYASLRFSPSRNRIQTIVRNVRCHTTIPPELSLLSTLADSDIFWERIKDSRTVTDHSYPYVYDLTVNGSHNFLVNGLVVHNTATVVKDEQYMGGWVLEAGAIVLANKGLLSIDEFDKMAPEDMVAMHEALEQGCYDGGTELVLEDGTRTTMAQLVDPYLSKETGEDQRKDISGNNIHLFSSDFRQIRPSKIKAVRKHKEKLLYKLSLPTGHQLSITPHHPVLTLRNGVVVPVEAQKLRPGDVVPVPLRLSFHGTSYRLPKGTVPSDHKHKQVSFPVSTSPALCEWLGLLVAEGNAEVNRGVRNGVCFSNSDPVLLGRFAALTERLFSVTPLRQKGSGSCWFLRVISRPLYEFVSSLEPRLFSRSWDKALPVWINTLPSDEAAALLRGLFDGEGSVNERYGTVSFASTSRTLAVQVQQQLLRFGIFSGLYPDRSMKGKRKHTAYKVQLSGKDNISRFAEFIGFAGSRQARLERLLLKPTVSSRWNHLPGIVPFIEETRKALLLSYDTVAGHEMTGARRRNSVTKDLAARILGCCEQRLEQVASLRSRLEGTMTVPVFRQLREEAGISRSAIARALGLPPQTVWYWLEVKKDPETLRKAAEQLKKMCADMIAQKEHIERLRLLVDAPFEWVPVKTIVPVAGDQWVYDVEMNPTGVFIGNGILCHNSVSIAKASIVATLPAQTSVLAGGNPKFGRFDQYKSIADQITVPDTLLSRFDLKFALKDIPDEKTDRLLADHVLKTRESEAFTTPEIDPELIKRYISYSKMTCEPKLTKETGDILRDFYLKMRKMSEGGNAPVAITLRQFEALIRLSQASAKVQLSPTVRREDAMRAIRLMEFSMKQLGYDVEHGTFDVDKLEGGVSHSERTKIQTLFDIIAELSQNKKAVPVKDIEEAAKKHNITRGEVDNLLEKMKREGTLFEPSVGHIQKV